jgi:hypothetical protein
MSIWADIFKSLNIGGPTYFDKKDKDKPLTAANQVLTPPKGGLLGALGVGQVEKTYNIGGKDFKFQAVNMKPTTEEEKERFDLFQKNQASNERERRQRDEQARQSLVKETVDAAETTEEVTLPTPPTPPETGQTNNEESASSTEGDVKGGTVVANKNLDNSAIKPKTTLMSSYKKKKKGLLANEDQTQMLT